ncbi:flagellar basal body P-ring formation chaperone FlgA [Helicobacter marmotae]|uniref:Flagella basal body P-ring formation protein FlgA n=1 Tax=Helicobacter marmotae TaxID=152490 RepID=A0A3D8I223_9HELI|nr:flagellar basal body P-ring formation chaperone FlgA [Helicobacter marmotae]RDU59137.1 flagella basal body P-ring formation protein FlgA [Helicobacter marmotae]
MRSLILLLIVCFHILADDVFIPNSELHLKKSYQIHKAQIYSTDMFPHIDRHFKIATLPPDKFSLKLKSVDIKLIFARYGYKITSFESDEVEFVFVSDMREDKPLEFIQKMYIGHYGESLEIKNLLVRPLNELPQSYDLLEFELPPRALKKRSGTLLMKYRSNQSEHIKKLTFVYMLEATLKVVKSSQNIASNEIIDSHNTYLEKIPFERVGAEYMSVNELALSSAKSYIRANSVITKDKIKPKLLVRKGEIIHVVGYENGISMEVLLEAKQNGIYNEIINAQNPSSGKILRVRVIDESRGRIL